MKKIKRGIDRRILNKNVTFPLHLADGQIIKEDRRSNKHRRNTDYISEQFFFNEVPYSLIEPLITQCDILKLKAGNVLIEPQKPNTNLFLLLKGQLKVHIDEVDSKEGIVVDPGEFIGELSVVDGLLPSAYVVAEHDSDVLSIPENLLWHDFFRNGKIARNFLKMFAKRLRKHNEQIQRALIQELRLEHIQKELSIAHNIQASMLPNGRDQCRNFPQIDIETIMTPAHEVGGDFYDAFPLDKDHVLFCIGDVSGKGIPASLFMVKALTILREEVIREGNLVTAVENTNYKLCQDNDTCMFATVIVGILNVKTRIFSFINAGHNKPLYGPGGKNFRYLDSPKCIFLGVDEKAIFKSAQLQINKGDVLVLYTDGVTEAMNKRNDIFSNERLQNMLSADSALNAASIVHKIISTMNDFTEDTPQSDDVTILAVRYCI